MDSNSRDTWYSESELVEIIEEYDAVIAGLDPFSEKVISTAKKLKLIARRGIGFDKIDLEACRKRGIIVTNTPVEKEHQAVAEFTVGLIFDLTRNIAFSSQSLKGGSWQRARFLGQSVEDLTIGIVGLGHIGTRVAHLLSILGSRVIYNDPYVDNPAYQRVSLEQLFMQSDVVTLHTPRTPETEEFINRDIMSLLKKGSYIVNTARGELIKTRDLIEQLDNGTIASAALDVYQYEPPENDVLLKHERIITTPHIAAFTESSFEKIDQVCYQNVRNVLLGLEKPSFQVQ